MGGDGTGGVDGEAPTVGLRSRQGICHDEPMLAFIFAILAVWVLATPEKPQPWSDPDLGEAVIDGAADARYLWLRGQRGVLIRFDRQTGDRTVLGRDVVDLQRDGAHLWAAMKVEDSSEVSLSDVKNSDRPPFRIELDGEFVGLFATGGDRPGVLTSRQTLRPAADGWRSKPLAPELKCGDFPASYGQVAAAADGSLYLGCNVGEWGGGLQRIDPETGLSAIVSQTSEDLCGGLLNPSCDPVVGVFAEPGRPECMTVGTSLAHITLREGRILRICGDSITPVFAHPLPSYRRGISRTWAFDGLVPTHDGWVAFSRRRYARSRSGVVEMLPTPRLENWAGLRISEEQDGVLFVLEGCCWGYVDNPTEFRVIAVPVEPFVREQRPSP